MSIPSSRRSASSRRISAGSDASVCSGSSIRSKGSKTSRTSRSSTRPSARKDVPLDELSVKLKSEATERFGNMNNALKGLNTDTQGNVSRGEVRRLFEELGQNRQTADQCFDTMSDRGSVDVRSIRDVFVEKPPQRSRGGSRAGSEAGDLSVTIKPSAAHAVSTPRAVSLVDTPAVASSALQRAPSVPTTIAGRDAWPMESSPEQSGNTSVDGLSAKASPKDGTDGRQPWTEPLFEEMFESKNISPQLSRNLHLLGPALGRKFRTIRRAFRDVDTDHNNTVSREETREFFRNFGFSDTAPADEFFDVMDTDGGGLVDYREFQKVFAPYIYGRSDLGPSCLPVKPREQTRITSSRSTPNLTRSDRSEASWSARGKKLKDEDVSKVVGQVSDIMTSKYGTIRKAFKGVAENHESTLSRQDVRGFFRNYGFASVADQFFDRFDEGRGRINYRDFQAHFARHVEPSHTIAKRPMERCFSEQPENFDGQTTYRSSYSCTQARGIGGLM